MSTPTDSCPTKIHIPAATQPNLPVYVLKHCEHPDYPYLTYACDTHECLMASKTRDQATQAALDNKWPVIAHSERAASRRAMYLVGLYMRHASGRLVCTPKDIGGRDGSSHTQELATLCRMRLVRRRHRFCDIARDGSWTYALTSAGDAASICLIDRSNRAWVKEEKE